MKLLYCANCHDIIKLIFKPRFCRCGKTGGEYLTYIDIAVYGDKKISIPFEILNASFFEEIKNIPEEDLGWRKEFITYFIVKKSRRVNYRRKEEAIERLMPKRFDINFTKDITLLKILEELKKLNKNNKEM